MIPQLLNSLTKQDYSKMSSTRVLVADANSTDGTPDAVLSYRDRLDVRVVRGGMPSVGRNRGAALATTPYVLFIDADIELASHSLVRRVVETAQRRQLHCVTTNILCKGGTILDKAFYGGNDVFQYLSRLHRPFSTGMFMFFDKKRFDELGGFDERVDFAEDYQLSQKVARNKFAVVRGGVYTSNRRFQKMGHARIARLFFTAAFNYWNENFFLR
ncbi:MAG TPA: glycosyltransferase, partial [Terriglobales bacterium]